jgi:hypothetical protein
VHRESQRDEMPPLVSPESLLSRRTREPQHDVMPPLLSWYASIEAPLSEDFVPELLLPAAIEQPQQAHQELVDLDQIPRPKCDQDIASLDQESAIGPCIAMLCVQRTASCVRIANCNALRAEKRQLQRRIRDLENRRQRLLGMIHPDAVADALNAPVSRNSCGISGSVLWHGSAENKDETKADYEEASLSLSLECIRVCFRSRT